MTSVNIELINGITVVSVAGHAEYSKDHNDIVCAAISAITQSLMQAVKYYEELGKCKVLSEQVKEDIGAVLFSFKSKDKSVTDALLNMAKLGYLMLEKSYPKNICVNA